MPRMTSPTDTGQRCLDCDYNLTAITGDRCPECGAPIDWNLVELAADPKPVNAAHSMLAILGVFCGVGSVIVAGYLFPKGNAGSAVRTAYSVLTAFAGAMHIALLVAVVITARKKSFAMRGIKIIAVIIAAAQIIPAILFAISLEADGTVLSFMIISIFTTSPGTTLLIVASIAIPTRQERIRRLEMQLRRQPSPLLRPSFIIEFIHTHGDMCVARSYTPRKIEPVLEAAISETWNQKQREARSANRSLFNGQLARLVHWTAREGSVTLTVSDTDYKTFLGTNLFNAHLHATFGDECFANAIGTSAVIITSDGCLLMGRRSNRVAFHAGYLHTIGGMLEQVDRTGDTYDVFAAIRREIREELNLSDAEITDIECTALVRDTQIMQPELIFDVRVATEIADIRARFDSHTDEEHVALESVRDDPDAIIEFIRRVQKMTPIAVAALMLHGRTMWGKTWYENTAYVLLGDPPKIDPIARAKSDTNE